MPTVVNAPAASSCEGGADALDAMMMFIATPTAEISTPTNDAMASHRVSGQLSGLFVLVIVVSWYLSWMGALRPARLCLGGPTLRAGHAV